MKCEGWLIGDWDGYWWDGSHRFKCKLKSSHPNPTAYKIWSYSTKMPKMVQDGARLCKMVQDGARWCKLVQDGARWFKMVHDGAR